MEKEILSLRMLKSKQFEFCPAQADVNQFTTRVEYITPVVSKIFYYSIRIIAFQNARIESNDSICR